MSEQVRIWIKDLPGRELDAIRAALVSGGDVYMSMVEGTQGWRVKNLQIGENPFEDAVVISFAENSHHAMTVQADQVRRFYVVGPVNPFPG